jgi:hypothetical protein
MRATVINSKFENGGAVFLLENNGATYKAVFDVPLGRQARFVKKNATPGQTVDIEFQERGDNILVLKSMDFISTRPADETFEIDFSSEKGKEILKTINARIVALLENEAIKNKLTEMRESGKTGEGCREWLTLAAISTLFGLPKAGKDEQYNYLAEKLRELAAICESHKEN